MKLNNTTYIAVLSGIIILSLIQSLTNKIQEGLDDLPCELYTSLKTIEEILNGTTKLKTLEQSVSCLYPGQDKDIDYKSDIASKSYSFNDIIQNIFLSGKLLMSTASSSNQDAITIYTKDPILPILAEFVDRINKALDIIYKEPKNNDATNYLTQILNNNIFYFKDNNVNYCSNFRQSINYSMIIIKAIFSTGIANTKEHAAFLCFYTLVRNKNEFLTKRVRQINHKLKDIIYNSASLTCTNSEPPFILNLASYATGSEKTDFSNSGKNVSLDKQYSGGDVMKDVKFKACPAVTTQKPVTTTQKPVAITKKPVTTTQKPVTTTQKPVAAQSRGQAQAAVKK